MSNHKEKDTTGLDSESWICIMDGLDTQSECGGGEPRKATAIFFTLLFSPPTFWNVTVYSVHTPSFSYASYCHFGNTVWKNTSGPSLGGLDSYW